MAFRLVRRIRTVMLMGRRALSPVLWDVPAAAAHELTRNPVLVVPM